jgi:hypothetical protein
MIRRLPEERITTFPLDSSVTEDCKHNCPNLIYTDDGNHDPSYQNPKKFMSPIKKKEEFMLLKT